MTHGLGFDVPVIVRPSFDRYACSCPLPPARAAGFTQAAAMLASGTLPNSVLAGGGTVDRNDAKEMRHPSCDAVWHSGMCWNAPPTSLPFSTGTTVPIKMADT